MEINQSHDLKTIACPLCSQVLSYDPNDYPKEKKKNENIDSWLFEGPSASVFFPALQKVYAKHQKECVGAPGHCMFCLEEFSLDQMNNHVLECPKNQFKATSDYKLLLISDLNYEDLDEYEQFIKYGPEVWGDGDMDGWDDLDSEELEERERQELENDRKKLLPESVEKRRAEHPPPKLIATFWIHVLVPASLTLKNLDSFLRQIWFDEPCGHLSKFSICTKRDDILQGDIYSKGLKTDDYGGLKNSNVISKCVAKRLSYEFDFGSSSTVMIDSIPIPKEKIVKDLEKSNKIILLSRNEPTILFCQHCLFHLNVPFSELSLKNVATMSIKSADIGLCFSCYNLLSEKARETPIKAKPKKAPKKIHGIMHVTGHEYETRMDTLPNFIQDNINIANKNHQSLSEFVDFNSPRSGMCGYCEEYDQIAPITKFKRIYSNLLVYARTLLQGSHLFHDDVICIILFNLCPQFSIALVFHKDLLRFREFAFDRKTIGHTKEEFYKFLGLCVPENIIAKDDEYNAQQNKMREDIMARFMQHQNQRHL
jgi:hypothetical protein